MASLILKAHTPHQYTHSYPLHGPISIYYTGSFPLLVLPTISPTDSHIQGS